MDIKSGPRSWGKQARPSDSVSKQKHNTVFPAGKAAQSDTGV